MQGKIFEGFYKNVVKPILFQFNPEVMHDVFLSLGHLLGELPPLRFLTKKVFGYENEVLYQNLRGIEFTNPVGLAAGFDKDAHLPKIIGSVGFGFAELGSTTAYPYEGNPSPRAIRLKKDKGLIVNYGLKNKGVDYLIHRLQRVTQKHIPFSISVAKTNCKETADTQTAISDYVLSLKKLEETKTGEMYTINISCPNTFGGEPFIDAERLHKLMSGIAKLHIQKPVFIKMPAHLPRESFKSLLDVCLEFPHRCKGVVISNLIKDRSQLIEQLPDSVKGGVSGKPAQATSDKLIFQTYAYCGDKLTIIGVGGIFSAEDAYKKIKAGASLLQLITGMIYEGPQLIGQINAGLVELLYADGYSHISEAIGATHRE